ncbi:MAG: 3-alpha,7-alpha,12-alpha-trihydroxy-5-beta-cholest-24-enoyl-CoA hydratase [Novosphingobium sp.]|nr:3-alpha,7-alpha,12-alpha-trihydroxy-5-beta-cholest-24-enoyl-CoA hydratase [Novosphingobium sp.]
MAFDPAILLDHPPIETRYEVEPAKVMLYALGVGADELPFVYEDGLKTLPTMAVVMTYPGFIWRDPAFNVAWEKILHAETSVTLHAPLPVEGELVGRTTFGPILDKGADKGAIVYQTREIHTAAGEHLATVRNTTFLRGDGGFGGSPDGQPAPHPVPDRTPDIVETLTTPANLALIYRLSGDLNPLHVDPAVAKAAGFERPILHGLATYGVAGRALLKVLAGNDPARIRRIDARFSSPVFPGETIETAIWREGNDRAAFRCRVVERDRIVLNNGYVEFA